jgi:hypothetical protein
LQRITRSSSPCPATSEKQAMPRHVMNHRKRLHEAGILREKPSPRKLFISSSRV